MWSRPGCHGLEGGHQAGSRLPSRGKGKCRAYEPDKVTCGRACNLKQEDILLQPSHFQTGPLQNIPAHRRTNLLPIVFCVSPGPYFQGHPLGRQSQRWLPPALSPARSSPTRGSRASLPSQAPRLDGPQLVTPADESLRAQDPPCSQRPTRKEDVKTRAGCADQSTSLKVKLSQPPRRAAFVHDRALGHTVWGSVSCGNALEKGIPGTPQTGAVTLFPILLLN